MPSQFLVSVGSNLIKFKGKDLNSRNRYVPNLLFFLQDFLSEALKIKIKILGNIKYNTWYYGEADKCSKLHDCHSSSKRDGICICARKRAIYDAIYI